MNLGHARRYSSRLAKELAGDFYPGPVLMPHSVLRAMEPFFAFALGPARLGDPNFEASTEAMLRGRPDGPLLLALWASISVGEVSAKDIRDILRLFPAPLPDRPQNRGELLAFLLPRVAPVASGMLSIGGRRTPEARPPAERLGLGLTLTGILAQLPQHLAADRFPLPLSDLEKCQVTLDELKNGIQTASVQRFLATETRWARQLLDEGLSLRPHLGARLRRGVRAVVVRSRKLLEQIEDPNHDFFRRAPSLGTSLRWGSAFRAMLGVKPERVNSDERVS
ncbi:MAG: squalene/phytoene synthase family protein [Planctomycetota bacterium]|jgi:phytoene/squalene synthetase|nr:squalene/phytoene synthase family protein [Planctomycetota bacterium]